MSVAVKAIPGVEKVNVSLNKALVTIDLKPGNSVRLDQIRKAILDDAFTPKTATVTVLGRVVEDRGKPALKVTGTNQVYELASAPTAERVLSDLASEKGKTVLVRGTVPTPAGNAQEAPRLLVEGFSKAP